MSFKKPFPKHPLDADPYRPAFTEVVRATAVRANALPADRRDDGSDGSSDITI